MSTQIHSIACHLVGSCTFQTCFPLLQISDLQLHDVGSSYIYIPIKISPNSWFHGTTSTREGCRASRHTTQQILVAAGAVFSPPLLRNFRQTFFQSIHWRLGSRDEVLSGHRATLRLHATQPYCRLQQRLRKGGLVLCHRAQSHGSIFYEQHHCLDCTCPSMDQIAQAEWRTQKMYMLTELATDKEVYAL